MPANPCTIRLLERLAMSQHRSTPKKATITHIRDYPKKLTLFQIEASNYWWVRYYKDGKVIKRSTKTDSKRDAIEFAKQFFAELHTIPTAKSIHTLANPTFKQVAEALIDTMAADVSRKDITKQTADGYIGRLKKHLIPFFETTKIKDFKYNDAELFLKQVSKASPPYAPATITALMRTLSKLLNYAYKHELIPAVPRLPTTQVPTENRGRFNIRQYVALHRRASALYRQGAVFQYRVANDETGKWVKVGTTNEGKAVKRIEITYELAQLVLFMTNSYIRPTDIKNIQHKHVEVRRNSHDMCYLILNLPKSKRKDTPFHTQPTAHTVYQRLIEHNKKQGWGVSNDDYLFFPNASSRQQALKTLQNQFKALLQDLDMQTDVNGKPFALYSLRHTAITFTLQYRKITKGELADNARTSVEMIDNFYSQGLGITHAVDDLHSPRNPRRNQK